MNERDTGRLIVEALGHTIDLGVLPEALPRLQQQWSRCRTRTVPAVPDHVIDLGHPADHDGYDYAVAAEITLDAVAMVGANRLNLHAAGVAAPDGRVLTLVAASGTGKTTACALLARQLAYVTDECVSVGLDDDSVLAFPRPLSFRSADSSDHKAVIGPDELGLPRPRGPLRVGPLVLLDRRHAVDAPQLVEMDWESALLDLIPQTTALPRLPGPLQVLVDYVRRAGGAYRLTYAEIDAAAPLLHALLSQAPSLHALAREPVTVIHHAGELPDPATGLIAPPDDAPPPAAGDLVQRNPWTDAVALGDNVLVLIGTQPVRLSGLGAALWIALGAEGANAEALVAACTAALGAHPDAANLVQATITELHRNGIVSSHRLN